MENATIPTVMDTTTKVCYVLSFTTINTLYISVKYSTASISMSLIHSMLSFVSTVEVTVRGNVSISDISKKTAGHKLLYL